MATTAQSTQVEEWIVDNIRDLWLLGTTYKDASETISKQLYFKVSAARISRLRKAIVMRLKVPFDDWHGRCRKSGWTWDTYLTQKRWDALGSWILRNKKDVVEIRDVLILGKMARIDGVKNVNPRTMCAALDTWKRVTGYDPDLTIEADGVASDSGSVGVTLVANGGTARAAPCSAAS